MTSTRILLALLATAGSAAAQLTWTRPPTLEAVNGRAAAFDATRGRLVAFGGMRALVSEGETWQWDGATWQRHDAAGPSARFGARMVHDTARGVVVLQGGTDVRWAGGDVIRYFGVDDTWEFDGVAWRQVATTGPGLYIGAAAYHAPSGRTVLYGYDGSTRQTWTWDGRSWTRQTGTQPTPIAQFAIAEDRGRGRVVLFGGQNGGAPLAETWEWDGAAWQRATPVASPPGLLDARLASHPIAGVVLQGGLSAFAYQTATWHYDGTTWRQIASAVPTDFTGDPTAMFLDPLRGRVQVLGGIDGASLWELDPALGWQLRAAAPAPGLREGHALAANPGGGSVLFGGMFMSTRELGDTWTFDGAAWTRHTPGQSPSPRTGHAMAHDTARGRTVLFGGRTAQGTSLTDTWEWDGRTWTFRAVPTPPTIATVEAWQGTSPSLAYDPLRQRTVLSGVSSAVPGTHETWEWDGAVWQRIAALGTPQGTGRVAFDANLGRVVLVGERGCHAWDGSTWTPLPPLPSPRTNPVLAFDPTRRRLVAANGVQWLIGSGVVLHDDVWEFDGGAWVARPTDRAVPLGSGVGAFDEALGRTVVVGARHGTLLLGSAHPAALDVWSAGCQGVAGTPQLATVAGALPWLGDSVPFRVANTAQATPAVLLLGWSGTSWHGTPLPFDLGVLGAPGCRLATSIDGIVPFFAGALGGVDFVMSLPAVPALAGLELYQQALVADATANTLGVTISNANRLVLGTR